jgi:hypothetical protein
MPDTSVPAAATGLPASTRKKIEAALERSIAALDLLDPDPDLEQGGDDEPDQDEEPSLGATHALDQGDAWRAPTALGIDLEFDGETAPSADSEPSLGSPEHSRQIHWAQGGRDDREDDDEREWDPAESGVGDVDGLIEQFPDKRGPYGERVPP